MIKIGLDVPQSGVAAHHRRSARGRARRSARCRCIIRPAFTLGGTGGGIAYNHEEFEDDRRAAASISRPSPKC